MYAAERQQLILDRVRTGGNAEVAALAVEFEVTPETIRRDLGALERRGVLRRTHGGAIPVHRLGFEPSFAERVGELPGEKARIARAALAELPDGGAIAFDAGTTVAGMIELLPTDRQFIVVTHAHPLAAALSSLPNVTLHLVGGAVRSRTLAAVGPWAERAYGEVHVDVAFVGTNGLTAELGLTAPDVEEASVKRALIGCAQRTVVLVDHSKLGRNEFGIVCGLDRVDTIVTDDGADPEFVTELESTGVRVVLA